MSRNRRRTKGWRGARGLSLIELMISIALGSFLVLGILTLYSNVANVNNVQSGLARMQENARFAMLRLQQDLRMAGAQYCSSTAIIEADPNTGQSTPRSTLVWVDQLTEFPAPSVDDGTPPVGTPWELDPRFFISGHECDDAGDCVPAVTVGGSVGANGSDLLGVPAPGDSDGSRPFLSDVLTIRYVSGDGVTITADVTNLDNIVLSGDPTAPPLNLQATDRIMLSECTGSDIFDVTVVGNELSHLATDGSNQQDINLRSFTAQDTRVFNFGQDMVTVSYYLAFKDDPDLVDRVISSLYRQVNGVAQELVEGVERFDLLYGVEDGSGLLSYLTADEVDSRAGGAIDCPIRSEGINVDNPNCLWGSVRNIELSLLMNTVSDYAPTSEEPYYYSVDGSDAQNPGDGLPSTVDGGRMMRRELNMSVSVRNYNR